jgi:cofilin
MLYACSKEQLKKALDVNVSIHADSLNELEWKLVLKEASGGKA